MKSYRKPQARPVTPAKVSFDPTLLSHAAAVIAPVVIMVSSILYVCGFTQRKLIGGAFGVGGVFAEPSLQATMAEGYPAALLGTLILTGLGLFLFGIVWIERRYSKRQLQRVDEKRRKRIHAVSRVNTIYAASMFVFFTLAYGLFAGAYAADKKIKRYHTSAVSGCHTLCHYVVTDRGNYRGVVVAQDSSKLALYTREGTRLFDMKDVKLIAPITDDKIRADIQWNE